jgi:branched-chain amino acid transport system substrate-binding protein
MIDTFAEGETPAISLASSIRIIAPVDAKKAWAFETPQTDVMMAGAILEHATTSGIEALAYIGFNDGLGEVFFAAVDKAARANKLPLVANERYVPKDTSVTGQVLKLIAAKLDAIVIGSVTPAALPASTLVDRVYKGTLYFNHGVK